MFFHFSKASVNHIFKYFNQSLPVENNAKFLVIRCLRGLACDPAAIAPGQAGKNSMLRFACLRKNR